MVDPFSMQSKINMEPWIFSEEVEAKPISICWSAIRTYSSNVSRWDTRSSTALSDAAAASRIVKLLSNNTSQITEKKFLRLANIKAGELMDIWVKINTPEKNRASDRWSPNHLIAFVT